MSENSDSQSSGEESLPDINKLKPMISGDSEEQISTDFDDSTSGDSDEEEQRRIGNVNWCNCGRCQPIFTSYTEKVCVVKRRMKFLKNCLKVLKL